MWKSKTSIKLRCEKTDTLEMEFKDGHQDRQYKTKSFVFLNSDFPVGKEYWKSSRKGKTRGEEEESKKHKQLFHCACLSADQPSM